MALGRGPEELVCSSRGCENMAEFAITWTNPALPFGRQKNWLTCADHEVELERYLEYRKFPLQTKALADFLEERGEGGFNSKSTGVTRQ